MLDDAPSSHSRTAAFESSSGAESPFLAEPQYARLLGDDGLVDDGQPSSATAAPSSTVESPFVSEYTLADSTTESHELELYREVLEEIHDDEFIEALVDLSDDLREVEAARFSGETPPDAGRSERFLGQYLMPLEQEIDATLGRLLREVEAIDNEALTEPQLEQFLKSFDDAPSLGNPVFEDFFGKVFKKIKRVAKKGLNVAKKVGKLAAKFSPIGLALRKLRKLVRPLLEKVLRFALNKLPARYRPLAKKLARRFLSKKRRESAEELLDEVLMLEDLPIRSDAFVADSALAAYSPEIIASEFDAMVAGYLIDGEDYDNDPGAVQFLSDEQLEGSLVVSDLGEARERFVREFLALDESLDPIVPVENFVTAVLAGLKVGVKIIGRRRVVNFLSKHVAKLIRRFVGKQAARPLARALVDAGLKLVRLESPEDAERASAEAIAATIESAVESFVTMTPEEAFDSPVLLEIYVQEAVEKGLVGNLPPSLLRAELRESRRANGVWTLRPTDRRQKHYKKYTRVFDVELAPGAAGHVRTFGGQSLESFLVEQMGLDLERAPVAAKLHLYEAIRGTSLSHISMHERDVSGLGSGRRHAWVQLHPLTHEATSYLLPQHAGLCRAVPPRLLLNRNRIGVGQRFYFLEIGETRPLLAPGSTSTPQPARASEINVTLDFRDKMIRIFDFFSEAAATELTGMIRAGGSATPLVRTIRRSLDQALPAVLSGGPTEHLSVRREAPAEEDFVSNLVPVLRFLGVRVAGLILDLLVKQLVERLRVDPRAFSSQFTTAADAPADGVTLVLTLDGAQDILALLVGGSVTDRARGFTQVAKRGASGSLQLDIRAGFQRA